jgi:hypothetical protein
MRSIVTVDINAPLEEVASLFAEQQHELNRC